MSGSAALRRTALHGLHRELGAKLVEFGGYEMPVQYDGILAEHEAVRKTVGIFDVSHMSNLWVTGPLAADTLSRALVANVAKIPVAGTKYTCVLDERGAILDDLYVFHVPRGYHVIPNAGKNEVVATRIRALGKAPVEDVTSTTAILAVQGPRAEPTLESALGRSFGDLKRFHVTQAPELGRDAFVSRTGYTGEDGFELVFPSENAEKIFRAIVGAGAKPCGLGARDTLRLEKGFCLAGNEFAPSFGGVTPLEAGLGWLVDWEHDFGGKLALERQRAEGPRWKLAGLRALDRGIPRQGMEVRSGGRRVGEVTSGTQSPILRSGIALAYVEAALAKAGTDLEVVVRDKSVPVRVVKLPFV